MFPMLASQFVLAEPCKPRDDTRVRIDDPVHRITPGLNARSVLVVDDEPAVARTIDRLLTRSGFAVTTASGGREALDKLAHTRFDAIVSDLDMPDKDGGTLLRDIRAMDLDVPFLLLTGRPDLNSAIDAVEYGACRYLVKPVPPDELVKAVRRAAHWHEVAVLLRAAEGELSGDQIGDRARLEARFATAVERLWMATQPIISWANQRVLAYEVLVRTREPTLANPTALFDAAERLGAVHGLGRRIRAQVAALIPSAPPDALIFVNLHPSDLEDDELCSPASPLTHHASRVVLEITERATLDRISGLSRRVRRLRDLGFRIAVDDLGAGYAGLSSFASIEPDVVKVDMSLVHGIESSCVKQKLVGAIAGLAKDLGIGLIAEGIETAAERDCVTSLGADELQGYLFARPGPGFPPVVY